MSVHMPSPLPTPLSSPVPLHRSLLLAIADHAGLVPAQGARCTRLSNSKLQEHIPGANYVACFIVPDRTLAQVSTWGLEALIAGWLVRAVVTMTKTRGLLPVRTCSASALCLAASGPSRRPPEPHPSCVRTGREQIRMDHARRGTATAYPPYMRAHSPHRFSEHRPRPRSIAALAVSMSSRS